MLKSVDVNYMVIGFTAGHCTAESGKVLWTSNTRRSSEAEALRIAAQFPDRYTGLTIVWQIAHVEEVKPAVTTYTIVEK